MRWPILTLAILGLLCLQVALVCSARLLSFVRREAVFTSSALPWVNGIIAAFLAGGVVCLATLGYQGLTVYARRCGMSEHPDVGPILV